MQRSKATLGAIIIGLFVVGLTPTAIAQTPEAAAEEKPATPAPQPEAAAEEKPATPAPAPKPEATAPSKKLTVGTKTAPPFAFKRPDGTWTGISIELWRDIANDLELEFELKEFDLKGLLNSVEKGDVDVAVAAITITADREKRFDFSHPFFFTGLGIVVPNDADKSSTWASIKGIFSADFIRVISLLCLLLFVVGVLIWLLERKGNPDEFSPGVRGIGDGFWWSAVTMTTVGYGDAAPKSFMGRILGLFWMFAAILIISFFTAQITSALTVSQLDSGIQGPKDLPKVTVGSVEGSSTQRYLTAHNIISKGFDSLEAGMQAVANKEIDAFVHDRPILQYYAKGKFAGTAGVLDAVFDHQTYGLALPSGSIYRKRINERLLVRQSNESYWRELQARFLGEQ